MTRSALFIFKITFWRSFFEKQINTYSCHDCGYKITVYELVSRKSGSCPRCNCIRWRGNSQLTFKLFFKVLKAKWIEAKKLCLKNA